MKTCSYCGYKDEEGVHSCSGDEEQHCGACCPLHKDKKGG